MFWNLTENSRMADRPDAERDRRWGMEDGFGAAWMNTKCDNRDGSARYSGGVRGHSLRSVL